MTKDLTKGSIPKLLITFFIPLLFGRLFQQVYSMVDAAIVGKALGVMALGGVGSTGSLNFLILGFCDGLTAGFVLPVAQAFGARNEKQLRTYVTNAAILSAIAAVVLLLVVLPLTGKLLTVMGTPEEQYAYAYDYIFIIFAGIPTMILYNLTAGIIRSLGDSKTPIYFLVIASLLNIIGDFLLVVIFGMGVKGAAWATVISQLISGVLCFIYMKKKFTILHMEKEDWKLDRASCRYLLSNGVPMGLQFSITAVGAVVMQSSVNALGAVYVSANAVAQRVTHILIVPFQAYLNVSSTFTGQNMGAGEFERIKKGVYWGIGILTAFWAVELAATYLIGSDILLLFLKKEEIGLVEEPAMMFIRFYAWGQFFLTFVQVVRLAIQGMSFSKLALIAGMLEMLPRILLAVFVVPKYGYVGSCLASPSAWLMATIFLIPAFEVCFRRRKAEYEQKKAAETAANA